MATFTFGRGNLLKIIQLPVYAFGAVASRLVPRNPRLWVFGSGIGLGEGALPLYRRAREVLPADHRLVWLGTTADEVAQAQELGLESMLKSGRRGLWTTLRAGVMVVTHGFGDVNRSAVFSGLVVQLWHGVPLKRLHLDSAAALKVSFLPDHRLVRQMMAASYRAAGRRIGLFPVASELVRPRIASAFGLPIERVVVTGDIRDDCLLAGGGGAGGARAEVEALTGPLPEGARLVLYAPTWRDGEADPTVPEVSDWLAITDWLERTNSVLLVRVHPLGRGDYDTGRTASGRIRNIGSDVLHSVTSLLPAMDALVTDYSSIAYDYSLVGGPIVYLAPDVAAYSRSRGLYRPYGEFSGGTEVASWPEVLNRLDSAIDDPEQASRHTRWLRQENFDYLDGQATDRVLAEIVRRVGLEVPGFGASVGPTLAGPTLAGQVGRPRITGLVVDGTDLVLTGEIAGGLAGARLQGRRHTAVATVTASGDSFEARFSLTARRWGGPELPWPRGSYRLVLEPTVVDGGAALPTSRIDVQAGIPEDQLVAGCRLRCSASGGELAVRISPALLPGERGAQAQERLARSFLRSRPPIEDAVVFESFYSRSATDNPYGIDRALARLRPDIKRYWSVADGSVAVPEGSVAVLENSAEWWRVRRSARALVVNDWLRGRYRKRHDQLVLQTWHGTMLKHLALDRGLGLRGRLAVRRESRRWDVMLAQNPYSEQIFRTAYDFAGPIWTQGYPRNDVLFDDSTPARVRANLGLMAGQRVVLWAPTWRDDRAELVDHLDPNQLAVDLGPDWVVLVRGHSRTLAHGGDRTGPRVLDVTSYPSAAELLSVTEMLITDYSSIMFDFASTGRPMIFFTPDLAHYSSALRGFYFDLLAEAPGPVIDDPRQLAGAVQDLLAEPGTYAARLRTWKAKFTPLDDGHAGDRVVEELLRRW